MVKVVPNSGEKADTHAKGGRRSCLKVALTVPGENFMLGHWLLVMKFQNLVFQTKLALSRSMGLWL